MAKAIEYFDQFIPALGEYDQKANEAMNQQSLLEKGIEAQFLFPMSANDNERVEIAMNIVNSIQVY